MLFKNYYDNIPDELIDSAVVDGCDIPKIYKYIFLPLSLPGFAVVMIFQFTNIWNEFLFGLTLTQGVNSQPVTVAVANLQGTTVAAWNQICAGAIISTLPVLIIYMLLLKLVIKRLLMSPQRCLTPDHSKKPCQFEENDVIDLWNCRIRCQTPFLPLSDSLSDTALTSQKP